MKIHGPPWVQEVFKNISVVLLVPRNDSVKHLVLLTINRGLKSQKISQGHIKLKRAPIPQAREWRVPREQKMLKGHLPRVTYHQVY